MDDSEAKIIITFLFKRSGKEELKPSELYLPLSMDLKWFSPKQAKAFVNLALHQKLLTKKDGLVQLNFDYKKIVVPLGFHPSEQLFEEKEGKDIKEEKLDVMKTIIGRIVEKTGQDEPSIIRKIKDVEKEKNICSEVALLFVSREYDVDVDDCFDEVEETIFRESKE